MVALLLLLLLLLLLSAAGACTAAFDVVVTVGPAHASTIVTSLTSVTMDVCLCKQDFPFDDPTLLKFTSHLGGGASILRVGGSDQNDFYYDVNSTKRSPYSAKSGEKCCKSPGSCHGCAKDCTMPAPYWKTISDFANQSGHKLMFGLVPETDQATALITHSAKAGISVFAYTFGNEQDSDTVTQGYPVLRKLLSDPSIFPAGTAPKLASAPGAAGGARAPRRRSWNAGAACGPSSGSSPAASGAYSAAFIVRHFGSRDGASPPEPAMRVWYRVLVESRRVDPPPPPVYTCYYCIYSLINNKCNLYIYSRRRRL
jgi:hypothetical protein